MSKMCMPLPLPPCQSLRWQTPFQKKVGVQESEQEFTNIVPGSLVQPQLQVWQQTPGLLVQIPALPHNFNGD